MFSYNEVPPEEGLMPPYYTVAGVQTNPCILQDPYCCATNEQTQSMPIPFEGLPATRQQVLSEWYYRSAIQVGAGIVTRDHESYCKRMEWEEKAKIDQEKAEKKEKRLIEREERNEQRQVNKEAETIVCYLGAERCIWMQVCRPNGKDSAPTKVVNCPGIRLELLQSLDPSGRRVRGYRLMWDSDMKGLILSNESLTVDRFPETLGRAGISIIAARRNRKIVIMEVISCLFANAVKVEIPFGFGWHKDIQGIWHFVDSRRDTYLEVIENENCK